MTLVWQGRQDSNLRMPGSKPGALGLLATPLRMKPAFKRPKQRRTRRALRRPCPQAGRQTRQRGLGGRPVRSEEHTSELQSLMRISYAVFCLKKKKPINHTAQTT